MKNFKEGDEVQTDKGEHAIIYVLHPNAVYAVLKITGQFVGGAPAFRTVALDTLQKVAPK